MNKQVENTLFQINNTLEMLFRVGFLRSYKEVSHQNACNKDILTWNNHVPGRFNSGDSFTTFNQYISIYENGAYHGIVNDGSIIRVYFAFERNILKEHSLLFWPSPLIIPEEDIDELGIREAMQMYLCDLKCESINFRMRTPIRIDYDAENDTEEHPSTHMHFQHAESRVRIEKPICFNTFMRFIVSYIYPHISLDLRNLNRINYSGCPESKVPHVINL
jgi:hypothetical protein